MKKFALLLFAVAFVSLNVGFAGMKDDDKPKYTNKQVMAKMFKGKAALKNKLVQGTATAEEKKMAVALASALSGNEPKKGDSASWKKKTAALLAATKAIQAGDEGAVAKFNAAANCKSCHTAHK